VSGYVSVIGGITLDIKGVPAGPLISGTSNPGWVYTSAGGVGHNIAHKVRNILIEKYDDISDVMVHVEPFVENKK